MLIRPKNTSSLLFDAGLEIFAPGLLFIEIERNKNSIIRKAQLSEQEFYEFLRIVKRRIMTIEERDYKELRDKADAICPDPKDIDYFALALYLNCPVWTNEKKLKEQSIIPIYATHELMELLK